jgi:histidinol-phosphate aminotransferase
MESQERHARPVHGGLNIAELESLGLRQDEVIDFSASINPLGPSRRVLEAAQSTNLAAYPDPECLKLRQAIGSSLGVAPERILAGNGSTELIHLLARAYLSPGRNSDGTKSVALVFAPTFGEYEAACRVQGMEPVKFSPDDDELTAGAFGWDISAACGLIGQLRPSLVFLCNPNNPTGVYLRPDEVEAVTDALQGVGILALDEAYVSFVDDRWDSTPLLGKENVTLLRSMTKDYALTGLRLGYMLASEEVIDQVKNYQYTWSVNAPAQAAGIAAIAESEQVEKGRDAVREGKEFLMAIAESVGLECAPAAANFLLFRVGDATERRMDLLTRYGMCVRDCTSFGLPDYIRVGVRTMEDNRRLANALTQILAPGRLLA